MEVTDPHDAQIVEVAVEVSAGKCRQVGTKYCGGAACGFSDGVDGANDAKERAASMKKLWISVILCIIFMAIEVIGGIKANSLAIMTDALHLLSDVAAFGISLFSLWAAGWEANSRQSYGFFRIEILGTLVSIQLIWLLTGIVVYEAIDRMINDTGYVEGLLMFVVAAFGLVVNVIMALLLGHDHGHGHSHGHGDAHDHFHEREHGPSGRNKHAGSEPHHVHHDHGDKHQGEGHRHEKVRSEQHLEHEQGSITVLSDNDLLKQPLISHFEDGCTGESAAKGKPKEY